MRGRTDDDGNDMEPNPESSKHPNRRCAARNPRQLALAMASPPKGSTKPVAQFKIAAGLAEVHVDSQKELGTARHDTKRAVPRG